MLLEVREVTSIYRPSWLYYYYAYGTVCRNTSCGYLSTFAGSMHKVIINSSLSVNVFARDSMLYVI